MEHVQSILKLAKDAGKEDLAKQLEEFVLVQNNLPEGNSKEDVIKNYLKKHGFNRLNVEPLNAFLCACEVGDLAFVKYLCANFNLNVEDARACNNWALRCAAENGHLEVIKYLYEYFGLTVRDARVWYNWALREAATNGHLEVVKYLIEEVGLTIEDARDCDMQDAVENGHTEVVEYLQNLATTPKSNTVVNFDVYQFDCDLTKLRERCEAKQREIAQKRIENMKQQVQKYLNDIKKKFEEAVERGMSTITIKIDRDFVKPVRGYLESVGLVVKQHSGSIKVMLYEEEYVYSSDEEDGCEEPIVNEEEYSSDDEY